MPGRAERPSAGSLRPSEEARSLQQGAKRPLWGAPTAILLLAAFLLATPGALAQETVHEIKEPGRSSDDPEIPKALILAERTKSSALAFVASALPALDQKVLAETVEKFYEDDTTRIITHSRKDVDILVMRLEEGRRLYSIVKRSARGHPILPASVLERTVVVPDLSKEEHERWLEAISRAIARKGACRVLVQFDGGNGADIDFFFRETSPGDRDVTSICYRGRLVKPGEFSTYSFDVIVSGATKLQTTKYGNAEQKLITVGATVSIIH